MAQKNLLNYIIIDRLRYWLLATIFIFSFSATAQKMSVESFELLENDLTANTQPNIKYDQNGDKCALIKIQTTQKGFMFDVGTLGVVDVVEQNTEHPSEIWLYVPHGVKKISIQHNVLGSINDYDLGLSVQKPRTYRLKLTTDQVNTLVVDYENRQYLQIDVNPNNADCFINGLKQQSTYNGKYELLLPFGTHTYRISAPNYHHEDGQVQINDRNNKHHLSVNLKPAFGLLTLYGTSETMGAEVHLDGVKIGLLPIFQYQVKSGKHKLTISKALYNSYSTDITMTDNEAINLTPSLEANFADVTIYSTDPDSRILIDGIDHGSGTWRGKIEEGTYTISTQKTNHSTISQTITVKKGETRSFTLDSPKPIYGALNITTTPPGVNVYIDNKYMGQTPFYTSEIIIGSHSIGLKKENYTSVSENINITKNQTTSLNKTLSNCFSAMFSSDPSGANISVNGVNYGYTPTNITQTAGSYKITVEKDGYHKSSKTIKFDENLQNTYFNLKEKKEYFSKTCFTASIGYNPLYFNAIEFGLGWDVKHFSFGMDFSGPTIEGVDGDDLSQVNFNFGYGFKVGNRFRISPNIGLTIYGNKNEDSDSSETDQYVSFTNEDSDSSETDSYASFTIGTKAELALTSWLVLNIAPRYVFPTSEDNISTTYKKEASGFSCAINLQFRIGL